MISATYAVVKLIATTPMSSFILHLARLITGRQDSEPSGDMSRSSYEGEREKAIAFTTMTIQCHANSRGDEI